MVLDSSRLIVEHDLSRLGVVEQADHVAHVLCLSGQISFVYDGRPFLLRAGEAMIIRLQELIEQVEATSSVEVICIYIRADFVERCTPRSNYGIRGSLALYSSPVMQMDAQRLERLHRDFVQVEERSRDERNPFAEDALMCATQMMFLDFFDIHAAQYGQAGISAQSSDLMARFLQLLERGDYVKHREVSYYADKLYVTPKYLSEVSKGVSGRTANYWIIRFTTIHIRRLLQERELTLTQIADLFEFSSAAYFSRFVQKHLGVPPSAFRE